MPLPDPPNGTSMPNSEMEIVVDDPTAPDDNSPAVTSKRTVDLIVSLLLMAFAILMAWDNWKTGASWDSSGPQAGYFPFYLAIILGGAALFGFVKTLMDPSSADSAFVTRAQFGRVMVVLAPTFLFCLALKFLGLYVSSFLLIAGFMGFVGKITWWKSILTAFVFTAVMFIVFDVYFDVLMPKGPLEALIGR